MTIPTYEERLEAELEEKRRYIKEYADEKAELHQRLLQASNPMWPRLGGTRGCTAGSTSSRIQPAGAA